MAKGFFTQCMCLLTDGRTTADDVATCLEQGGFEIAKRTAEGNGWFSGPTVVIPFQPEVNGYTAVDVLDRPWPDAMGDPKSDAMLFGAWSMGYFGPFTFPGGLARAQQHAWRWPEGQTAPDGHRGFIRIRTSYVFGAEEDAPIWPEDYDPLTEMMFVSRVVLALFDAPGVACYFNPNGEVLRDASGFREVWEACREQQLLPLPLWMNVRFFKVSEELGFMDTVGNGQLDISDVEAAFPTERYAPGKINYYLRNATHYLLDGGRKIGTGESIDGPGEAGLSWSAERADEGLIQPPRAVLRVYPKSIGGLVRELIAAARAGSRG